MSQHSKLIVIFLLALLTNTGCFDTRGYRSSDSGLMFELKAALTRSGIPFQEDKDGFIRYESKYAEAVNRVRVEAEKELAGSIATRYEDKESRDYLTRLLSFRGVKYRVEQREDGEWVRWHPESEEQRDQIHLEIVQHNFDLRSELKGTGCDEDATPSNKSLNKDAAQVARRAC